jgi:hypothetical protein
VTVPNSGAGEDCVVRTPRKPNYRRRVSTRFAAFQVSDDLDVYARATSTRFPLVTHDSPASRSCALALLVRVRVPETRFALDHAVILYSWMSLSEYVSAPNVVEGDVGL